MNINFKVNKADLDKIGKYIEREVAKVRNKVAVDAYNFILDQDYPYWSGTYIASWQLDIGIPVPTPKKPPSNSSGVPDVSYSPPEKADLSDMTGAPLYTPVYISNFASHAYEVEFLGTPLHPDDGWYTASHAYNQVIMSFKFL